MTKPRGWKPTLRYSPVNKIIVDWGINNEPFSMCCMPQPNCEGPSPVPTPEPECCVELNVVEPVNTYDWHRWVPEIIAGFEGSSEDMAATYARRAAREFAIKTRVLKRQLTVTLQKGVYRYPLEPFEGEDIQGVMFIDSAQGACNCECYSSGVNLGDVSVNVAKQELNIHPSGHGCCGGHTGSRGPSQILVTVWAAPTEESCEHDVFLYDQYRREVTLGARSAYVQEAVAMGAYVTNRGYANFRGDSMVFARADRMRVEFEKEMRKARVAAHTDNVIATAPPTGLFSVGCCVGGLRR